MDPKVVLSCRVTVQRCISRETMFEAVYFSIYGYFHGFSGFQTFLAFLPKAATFIQILAGEIKKISAVEERKRISRTEEKHTTTLSFQFLTKGNLDFQPIETFNKLESKTIKIRFDSFSINETIVSGTQFFLFVIFNA